MSDHKRKNQWNKIAVFWLLFLFVLCALPVSVRAEKDQEEKQGNYLFEIETRVIGEGRLEVNQEEAREGEDVWFFLRPESGYEVEEVFCIRKDKEQMIPLIREEEKYCFSMPGASVVIGVSFLPVSESSEITTEDTLSEKEQGPNDEYDEKEDQNSDSEQKNLDEMGKVSLTEEEEKEQTTSVKEGKKGEIGVKQILDYPLDAAGSSYLNYESPITGKKMRVSLHRTDEDQVAYCLNRTKSSDKDDYNWDYEVVSNKDTKYTDLQRNILLCGYPANTVEELSKMYGTKVNARTAEQATQLAIWVGNYMIGENVTRSEAWNAHNPYNTGEYDGASLSLDILTRADAMRKQSLSVTSRKESEEEEEITISFEIQTVSQFYPIEGRIENIPEGAKISTGSAFTWKDDQNFVLQLEKGSEKLNLTFSKYAKEAKIRMSAKGTIPIPPSYDGILFYKNKDSDYQDVIVGKEVKPSYKEEAAVYEWKPEDGGWLHLKKTSEDEKIEGIGFHVTGPNQYEQDFLTDKNGEIDFGRLVPGVYTVTEKTPDRYVEQKTQTVELKNGDDKTITFHNVLRKMVIQVKKTDSLQEKPQGDASLVGALYTVYDQKQNEVDQIEIGSDQTGRSKKLPVGIYTVKETKAPCGYNLDETVYTVDGEKGDRDLELITYEISSKEKVIEGSLKIIKTLENPDSRSKEEIPAKGVRFTYFLKSDPDNKMTIILDETGTGQSGKMPYGIYQLEEETAPKGWKKIVPMTVKIEKEGEIVTYCLVNEIDGAKCKIVKKDQETGKQIASSAVRFQIRKKETNEIVSQWVTEPQEEKISEFTTNEEGVLMLPEKLQAGDYLLYELSAPEGYVKSEEPLMFTVPDGAQEEILIVMENQPQKQELVIQKTGPVLESTEEKNVETDSYLLKQKRQKLIIPVYQECPLEGVVYELETMEDVFTLDGTCRIKKGTVFEAVTDENGKAVFLDLYPGMYELREKKTLSGYLVNHNKEEIRLTASDSLEQVKTQTLSFSNRQQIPELVLKKKFGDNPYLKEEKQQEKVLFGLYAGEDIKKQQRNGKEGEVLIPKDSLLDLFRIGEDGTGISWNHTILPYGTYYMKEIATHNAYVLDEKKYEFTFSFQPEAGEQQVISVSKEEILNRPKEGKIELTKREILTGKLISGCEVEIKNEQGKTLIKGTTDRGGKVIFDRLPVGNYFYKEVKAPTGYLLDQKEYPFTIETDGQVVKVVMENKPETKKEDKNKEQPKEQTKKQVPKTGDDSQPVLFFMLAGISLAGMIGIVLLKKRK